MGGKCHRQAILPEDFLILLLLNSNLPMTKAMNSNLKGNVRRNTGIHTLLINHLPRPSRIYYSQGRHFQFTNFFAPYFTNLFLPYSKPNSAQSTLQRNLDGAAIPTTSADSRVGIGLTFLNYLVSYRCSDTKRFLISEISVLTLQVEMINKSKGETKPSHKFASMDSGK